LPVDPGLPATTHEGLAELIVSGEVDPIVGRTYPLGDAAAALADLAGRRATGKLVLVP
jgi:NADPH2:quinone reductase